MGCPPYNQPLGRWDPAGPPCRALSSLGALQVTLPYPMSLGASLVLGSLVIAVADSPIIESPPCLVSSL